MKCYLNSHVKLVLRKSSRTSYVERWSPERNEWVAQPIVLVIKKEAATEVKREWLYGETNKPFIVER